MTVVNSLRAMPRPVRLLLMWLVGLFVVVPLIVVVLGPALINLTK